MLNYGKIEIARVRTKAWIDSESFFFFFFLGMGAAQMK